MYWSLRVTKHPDATVLKLVRVKRHYFGLFSRLLARQVFCTHEDLHGDDLREYGGLEFPQINYARYNTRPYRYFYACGFRHLVGDSLIKMDLQGKKIKVRAVQVLRGSSQGGRPLPVIKDYVNLIFHFKVNIAFVKLIMLQFGVSVIMAIILSVNGNSNMTL